MAFEPRRFDSIEQIRYVLGSYIVYGGAGLLVHLTKIRTKLTVLLLLASLLATLVASFALSAYWIGLRIDALGDDLETTANALGETCHATLAFNLPEEADKLLLTLKGKPTVVEAAIFTPDARPFAWYRRDTSLSGEVVVLDQSYPVRRLGWNSLEVATEIVKDGERVGFFYLRDDLSTIWAALVALLLVIPLVVLASLGLTYAAIRRLQQEITLPIHVLAETAAQVSRERDYTLRADKRSHDEIGELTDAFNRMLGEIQFGSMALKASEQRYRTLLDTAPLPVLVQTGGVLLYLNPAAARLLQQGSVEDLRGSSFLDFIANEEHGKLLENCGGDVPTGELRQFPLQLTLPSGEARDVEVSSIDMEFDGFRSQLLICVDVTERLLVENQLARYRNHLESLVEERTTELRCAQEQLVQKERLAVLGQLTATVSHELRNPLGAIGNALYNLGMAMEADRRDLVERSLQVAGRNAERCDRIIGELLDYSRKGNLNEQQFAVDSWLEDVLGELSWPTDIRLGKDLASGARILGDGDRLRRAVFNLVINAQQALQEWGGTEQAILVATRCGDQRLEIIVEDNGPGVPAELRAKIFEPLFSTKNFGVGLGMPVVEEVMKSHQGGVELQVPEGHGCRFVLWLPLERVDKGGRRDG